MNLTTVITTMLFYLISQTLKIQQTYLCFTTTPFYLVKMVMNYSFLHQLNPNIDVFVLSGTWFSPSNTKNISGYVDYHFYRLNKR